MGLSAEKGEVSDSVRHVIPAKAGTSGGSAVSRLDGVTACLDEVPAFAGMTWHIFITR